MSMRVVNVIPISRAINKETLTYFTDKKIEPGAVVSVPLRKRNVPAVVVSSGNVSEAKEALKTAPYKMKKLNKENGPSKHLFMPAFLEACEEAGRFFSSTTGAVLSLVYPRALIDTSHNIPTRVLRKEKTIASKSDTHNIFALQTLEKDRIATYKSVIRETFADNRSLFFCVPTIEAANRMKEAVSKGITEHTFILHGRRGSTKIRETWEAAIHHDHPVLIIATPSFLGIARRDIGTIILEHESASAYKAARRPFLDFRIFAEMLAKRLNARIILGDILLRAETIYRIHNGVIKKWGTLKLRAPSSAKQLLVRMKNTSEGTNNAPRFTIVSGELMRMLETAYRENAHVFALTSRRGLSPITVCGDCGKTVLCTQCTAPLVLHKGAVHGKKYNTPIKNIFVCHSCGARVLSDDTCATCGSWRLHPLGIGTQKIEQELKTRLPSFPCFRLDKDSASTKKQAETIARRFSASPGGVLVGTEMALPYLTKTPYRAVISVDSLFTLPDFRINERVFNLLVRTRAKATKAFLIQTRLSSYELFNRVIEGDFQHFYEEELKLRKHFAYPPFSLLIKISYAGTSKEKTEKAAEYVQACFKEHDVTTFPAFISRVRKRYIIHAVLRVDPAHWPLDTILKRLRSLPPAYAVKVDPEDAY